MVEQTNKTEAPPLSGVGTDHSASLHHFLIESLTEYAVFALNAGGSIISWNAGATRTFGYSEAEILGRHFSIIFTSDEIASAEPAGELAAALSGSQSNYDRWHVRKDGTRFWGTNTVAPMYDGAGTLVGFTKLVRDTTASHIALETLSDSEERLRLLVESVDDYAIVSTDIDGKVTSWNSGAQRTFGYEQAEILGCTIATFYDANPTLAAGVLAENLAEAMCRGAFHEERWLVRKNGTPFYCSGRLTPLKCETGGSPRGFVMVAHDITERTIAAEELRRRAFNDALTQLPNRAAFDEHVGRAIASLKRRPANRFAVLFIDLDLFKTINDTHGHSFGDQVLEFAARRFERCVRSADIVARLGGDEFAILLNGISGLSDASDAVDRIAIEMAEPIGIDGRAVSVSASIGIALGSDRYESAAEVLRDADSAMYRAKVAGRARSVVFEPVPAGRSGQASDISADLQHAIERAQLRMVYQPIVRVTDGAITAFAALVRWEHPVRGLLSPAQLMAQAEKCGSIGAIDRWVLREACCQLQRWQSQRATAQLPTAISLRMSVKMSAAHLWTNDMLAHLRRTVAQTGVAPALLQLEFPQTAIGELSDQARSLVAAVRELGIRLHVDDFGIGSFSLARIGQLPIDALKIDRSFIMNIDAAAGADLVRTMVTLIHNAGLPAIAQGVQTRAQFAQLATMGCDYAQGSLFSEPLDALRADRILNTVYHAA